MPALNGTLARKRGKAKMKLCEQDYSQIHEVTAKLMQYGHRDRPGEGPFLIDELAAATKEGRKNILEQARDMALPPELPDLHIYDDKTKSLADHKREDVYPFWLGLGIVYEHFHSAKTIRGATTMKLIPEQYVEMNLEDAKRFGLREHVLLDLLEHRAHRDAVHLREGNGGFFAGVATDDRGLLLL